LVQELLRNDFRLRRRFARSQLEALGNDPTLLENMFFCDEAHFHCHGGVNRQDFRYWSDENPHWYADEPLHSPKVTVWVGIGWNGIVGPFFWERDRNFPRERGINARWYQAMLENDAIPALRQLPNFDNLVFMQDGAPAHFGNDVRALLDQTFPDRWMGRGSANNPPPIAWLARSPDLTPMDFFFWGYEKSLAYTDRPFASAAELRQWLADNVPQVPLEMVRNSFRDYQRRLQLCVERRGRSVEIR
jgi:hypothetical protein